MTDANVTPKAVSGPFTNVTPYYPPPVVSGQDGGRYSAAAMCGTGYNASSGPDTPYLDNGGASWPTATSSYAATLSQGLKADPWQPTHVYSLGTCEPFCGAENMFQADSPAPSYPPFSVQFQAYYDNNGVTAGEAGPEQSAVRSSSGWTVVSNQPAAGVSDLGRVKTYPANQVQFNPRPAISSFTQIRSYAEAYGPSGAAIQHEAAWDIFGQAHYNNTGISLECMFWTRTINRHPGDIGPLVESSVNFGDGRLWDLYVTPDTYQTGGVNAQYSYGIWFLQPAYQWDVGWVDILKGLRHFTQYYVTPSGTGAPANALDVPLIQITRGWETCTTGFTPLSFRLRDYRLDMS